MDFSRDELKRQVKDVDAVNAAAMPRWRELLERVFSGDVKATTEEKAALLGVPGRRQFFKIGGATIAGAALLAACGDDDDDDASPDVGDDGSGDDGSGDGGNMDLVLANTAISLEILAIDTYQTAIDSGLVTDAAVADAAVAFQAHHVAHRDALTATVNQAGGTPYAQTNEATKAAVVDPAVAALTDQAGVVKLAFDLETAAAQTYVFAAGELSTPALRSTIMTIGGVESRHAAILGAVGGFGPDVVFPGAFYKNTNPLPDGAVITG